MVRYNEIPRLDLFLQTPHSTERDDAPDSQMSESGDVGAGGDFVRGELVGQAVAGDEGYGYGVLRVGGGVVEDADGRGGRAPRG